MFTGIIESIGKVVNLKKDKGNLHITLESDLSNSFKIDQSVAHNGICLTVVSIIKNTHKVVAVEETLQKTNIGNLKIGDRVNIERSLKMGDRLDGHLVQGHVDKTAKCISVYEREGSYKFCFSTDSINNLVVDQGSICINGVSLTVINSNEKDFCVSIIPYTFEHTNFQSIKKGSKVNIEFDIIGKYITKNLSK
tara:strand:+ start:1604 stop:2185 length:582 start_codon:yes stop_codon:yes gene_type:complete